MYFLFLNFENVPSIKHTVFFFCACYNVQLKVSLVDEELNRVGDVCTCAHAHTDNWAFCARPTGSLAAWQVIAMVLATRKGKDILQMKTLSP